MACFLRKTLLKPPWSLYKVTTGNPLYRRKGYPLYRELYMGDVKFAVCCPKPEAPFAMCSHRRLAVALPPVLPLHAWDSGFTIEVINYMTGWWYTYPSGKHERQLG